MYGISYEISRIFSGNEEKTSRLSYDLRWLYRLQRERMKKHGISKQLKCVSKNNTTYTRKDPDADAVLKDKSSVYASKFNSEYLDVTTSYFRGDKSILTTKRDMVFQYFIVDVGPEINIDNEPYICPNCGNVSTVRNFIENPCEYCKTKFDKDNLFPFVSFVYSFDCLTTLDRKSNIFKLVVVLAAVFLFSLYVGINGFNNMIYGIFVTIIDTAIITGVTFFITNIVKVFMSLGKMIHNDTRMRKSKRIVKDKLQPYFPEVNAHKVMGDIISNFYLVMFSDDYRELSCYDSNDDVPTLFGKVVDSSIKSLLIRNVHDDGENIQLECIIATNDVILKHKRLVKRENDWRVVFERNKESLRQSNSYRPHATECDFCGFSYDSHFKYCKHCRKENNAREFDWIIESVERY